MALLDLSGLHDGGVELVLDALHKAAHDHGPAADGPHESPFLRRLIELFLERGLFRAQSVQRAFLEWQSGKHHAGAPPPGPPPPTPPGVMARWNKDELALVRLYLRSLPPHEWVLEDHMMLVDFLVQTYLPDSEIRSEAEWLITRAALMGKVEAHLSDKPPPPDQMDGLLADLPLTVDAAVHGFKMTPLQAAILDIGKARAAEYVTAVTSVTRQKMRDAIVRHAEEQMFSPGGAGESLESRLLGIFGDMNRDWRRIAITEAGNMAMLGMIATFKPGSKVRRVEQYGGVCSHCKAIHGRIMTIVPPDHPNKDPENHIWIGKDNYGRSSAKNKRVGGGLVPREKHELWWIPAGLMHPNCRGRWVPVEEAAPGPNEEFTKWLTNHLNKKP